MQREKEVERIEINKFQQKETEGEIKDKKMEKEKESFEKHENGQQDGAIVKGKQEMEG